MKEHDANKNLVVDGMFFDELFWTLGGLANFALAPRSNKTDSDTFRISIDQRKNLVLHHTAVELSYPSLRNVST